MKAKAMTYLMDFPDIGKRSPILKVYTKNLRLAYYLTNALIFLAIVSVFGYIKWQAWLYAERLAKNPPKPLPIWVILPSQLRQPPSIKGDGDLPATNVPVVKTSNIGVPVPVPDIDATQETGLTQEEIAMANNQARTIVDSNAVIQVVPDIGVYVPHEVEPAVVHKPPLRYPEMARLLDQEGTVFVQALVDLDGSVRKVVIAKSSNYPMLDTAAVSNVSEWKFNPALQNKQPVRVWVGSNVKFSLK